MRKSFPAPTVVNLATGVVVFSLPASLTASTTTRSKEISVPSATALNLVAASAAREEEEEDGSTRVSGPMRRAGGEAKAGATTRNWDTATGSAEWNHEGDGRGKGRGKGMEEERGRR